MFFLQTVGDSAEYDKLVNKIQAHVVCFRSDDNMQRFRELKNFKDYLVYRIAHREYEAKIATRSQTFEDFRRKHVESELNKFDLAVKSKQEVSAWGWSPLFQVFQKWPLHNFQPSPWDHTEEEWARVSSTLLQNISLDARTLDKECPHIVRAIMILMRTLEGRNRPLAHPMTGLSRYLLIELARSPDRSAYLTQIARDLPTVGVWYFPNMLEAAESFSVLHSDLAALLGGDPSKQAEVIDKIQDFFGKVAHRTVTDMVRMCRTAELADMWYIKDHSNEMQAKCEEVWICILKL